MPTKKAIEEEFDGSTKLNIHQRMVLAMKEIGAIQKDRTNSFQNYEYISEDAVKTAARGAFVRLGIVFTLSGTGHEMREYQNKKGEPVYYSMMSFTYRFTNAEKPDDFIEGTWQSAAADSSDKSHTKAITYAMREIIKSNFVISTGEPDPDGETPEIAPVRRTAPQRAYGERQNDRNADDTKLPDGEHEITVNSVRRGITNGKAWEALNTDKGRMFNNSGTELDEGTYLVEIENGRVVMVIDGGSSEPDPREITADEIPF